MLARIQELLDIAIKATEETRHTEWVNHSKTEFNLIRRDAHRVAHEIEASRQAYETNRVIAKSEGGRLGAWAAEIRDAQAEMEKSRKLLRFDNPTVKAAWEAAKAELKAQGDAYMTATDANEAFKKQAETMLDQAYITMRAGRAEIIDRVQANRAWTRSDEERIRRLEIKQGLQTEIVELTHQDEIAKIKAAERAEWFLFADKVGDLITLIGEKLALIVPALEAESAAINAGQGVYKELLCAIAADEPHDNPRPVGFAKHSTLLARERKVAEEAAIMAQLEAEAQAEIEAKAALERAIKLEFWYKQLPLCKDTDEVMDVLNEIKAVDSTIDIAAIFNTENDRLHPRVAQARMDKEKAPIGKKALKKVRVADPNDDEWQENYGKKMVYRKG